MGDPEKKSPEAEQQELGQKLAKKDREGTSKDGSTAKGSKASKGPEEPSQEVNETNNEGEPNDGNCSIINEYNEIMANIKSQNKNLERIKEELMKSNDPKQRKCIRMLYKVEEEKLNEELVKAMILQTKCPYQKWAEIPVTTNIEEDCGGCTPRDVIKIARQQAIEQKEQKEQEGCNSCNCPR